MTELKEVIAGFVQDNCKPALKKFVEDNTDLRPGENGFYSSAAENINRSLARHGLELPVHYANDLHSGRRIGKEGPGLSAAYRLGVALSDESAPESAIALFYLYVCGFWPAGESAQAVLNKLKGGPQVAAPEQTPEAQQLNTRMAGIESALIEIKGLLNKGAAARVSEKVFHPLVQALREQIVIPEEDAKQQITTLFEDYPSTAKSVLGILFEGGEAHAPLREHWLNLAYALGQITGQPWTPKRIEEEAYRVLGEGAGVALSQLSSPSPLSEEPA